MGTGAVRAGAMLRTTAGRARGGSAPDLDLRAHCQLDAHDDLAKVGELALLVLRRQLAAAA